MSKLSFPCYCLHRATDQSYCTLRIGTNRRVHYLGRFGSEESLTRFAELLRSVAYAPTLVVQAVTHARETIRTASHTAPPTAAPTTPVTVQSVYNHFQQWAPTHYRLPSGELSREIDNYRDSFRECLDLLGSRPVASLARSDLLAVRQRMVDRKLSRKVINQRVGRIVRVFVWAGDEDRRLVPDSVAAAFRLVKPLQPFRGGAVETEAVEAVPVKDLKAVIGASYPVLAAMLSLQLLTGVRPGEVRALRKRMVQLRDGQWVLDFERAHKMAYKGKPRIVPIGPHATELLRPWLDLCPAPEAHVFRPELAPKSAHRKLRPNYSKGAYTTAVLRACVKAGVPSFGPNRVRHLAATEIRKEFGLEAAQAVLGHRHYSTTERYASSVSELAQQVARKRG